MSKALKIVDESTISCQCNSFPDVPFMVRSGVGDLYLVIIDRLRNYVFVGLDDGCVCGDSYATLEDMFSDSRDIILNTEIKIKGVWKGE